MGGVFIFGDTLLLKNLHIFLPIVGSNFIGLLVPYRTSNHVPTKTSCHLFCHRRDKQQGLSITRTSKGKTLSQETLKQCFLYPSKHPLYAINDQFVVPSTRGPFPWSLPGNHILSNTSHEPLEKKVRRSLERNTSKAEYNMRQKYWKDLPNARKSG